MRPVKVEVDDTPKPPPADPEGRRLRHHYKNFLDTRLIPQMPFESEELELLRLRQRRLLDELDRLEESAPRAGNAEAYRRAKTEAVLNGGPAPEQPLTEAEVAAERERVGRDIQAVKAAIVRWGRELVDAVQSHDEWHDDLRSQARRARSEADELRRRAAEADARAKRVEGLSRWLSSVADEFIYVGDRGSSAPQIEQRPGDRHKLTYVDETGRAVG